MPIYEYKCSHCGTIFEKLRSTSEMDMPIPCESCGENDCKRQLSVFATKPGGEMPGNNPAAACPNAHVCGSGCAHSH